MSKNEPQHTSVSVPEMFTVQQVADRLHVHAQTVRGWVKCGHLGHYQIGRYRVISDEQLTTFLGARKVDGDLSLPPPQENGVY